MGETIGLIIVVIVCLLVMLMISRVVEKADNKKETIARPVDMSAWIAKRDAERARARKKVKAEAKATERALAEKEKSRREAATQALLKQEEKKKKALAAEKATLAKERAELEERFKFDCLEPPAEAEAEVGEDLWTAFSEEFASNPAFEMYSSVKDDSWADSSVSFGNRGSKSGHPYFSLYDYYPKNRYEVVPGQVGAKRKLIWDFKDGHNSHEVAKLIASALYMEFPKEFKSWSKSDTVLAIIPGSTKCKTETRFLVFCELVSKYLGIKNGFKAIEVAHDRDNSRHSKIADKTANLSYNASVFADKHVILFDDVKTSGGSFVQNATELKALGAKRVTGVFLGETYDSYTKGEPEWAKIRPMGYTASSFHDEPDDLPF